MSVLNAVVSIHREYHQAERRSELDQIPAILASGIGAEARFDYETALELYGRHPSLLARSPGNSHSSTVRVEILREAIASIIDEERPQWARAIPLGRMVVLKLLTDENARQCLESARLFSEEDTSFSWWDRMASKLRRETDDRKLEIGREGERLTMDHEKRRLEELGQELEPKWCAREDNTLGYDVTSYDVFEETYQEIYIDSKVCSDGGTVFHITRNEWKIAMQRPERYLFYVWHLPTQKLEIISAAQLSHHIPENRGNGKWEVAEIRWKTPAA